MSDTTLILFLLTTGCAIPLALLIPAFVLLTAGMTRHLEYADSDEGAADITGNFVKDLLTRRQAEHESWSDSLFAASESSQKPRFIDRLLFLYPGMLFLWVLMRYLGLLWLPFRLLGMLLRMLNPFRWARR